MTALDLARLQFALTAGLHFLFVTLTLGLAPLIAFMQTRYVLTGDEPYRTMTRFWGQLYVVNYGIGIASGLVMEFQFGLDWDGLGAVAGNVFGAPLALESLVAFFLESTFLGMWIFGWVRLPRWAHLVLIHLVALTAIGSAFFVMVANGFLQHPAGGVLRDGTFALSDVAALLTNPEALDAFWHVLAAALLAGGLVVAGVSAWHLRRDTGWSEVFTRSLRIGVVVAAPAALGVVNRGFAQFDYLRVDQPGKLAEAFGGTASVPAARAAVPGGQLPPSWIAVPAAVMQDAGFALAGLCVVALLALLVARGRPTRMRWLLRPLAWAVPVPFVLVLCGWVVREEGRQPWVVYGVLRTSDALSPTGPGTVVLSLGVFVGLVACLGVLDVGVLRAQVRRGPGSAELPDAGPVPAVPARAL